MESAVIETVPTKLNYVEKMKLFFESNRQESPNCASHTISPKETTASTVVNDIKYKMSASVISTEDSSTRNESESENLRNTAIAKDNNWKKRSGQQLIMEESEPKIYVSKLFLNETSFGAFSNNENQYLECNKENSGQHILKQIKGTHYQVPALQSKSPGQNARSIPYYLNSSRNNEMTSIPFKNCDPKLNTVPYAYDSCLEEKNLEVLSTNEPNEETEINRLSINNLDENSTEGITEEYRTSLLRQIERDLDRMRQDGFLDDDEFHHVLNDNTCLTYISRNKLRDSAISSSDRTTKYSSTSSMLSCNLDDYDEGIGMDRYVDERADTESKSLYNEKGAERCEIQENVGNIAADREVSTTNGDSPTTSKRMSYIVDEIISTERKYVEDLMKIVRDFIPYLSLQPIEFMEVPAIDDLFTCLKDILRHHMDFLKVIENFENIDSIINTLISNNCLLCMYPIYFRNKPKTDELLDNFNEIFKDMKDKFGDRFDLSTYLMIPIQKLGRYKLFLEKIEKEQKKLNISNNQTLIALDMVKSQMSRGNTYITIDSIKDSPLGECYENYGSFVDREKFDKSKYMVFLFEKVVVFTTINQTNSEIFHYHDSIKMENLNITTLNNFTIVLTDSTKIKSVRHSRKYGYILEAKTEKIWMDWKKKLSYHSGNKLEDKMPNCDSKVYKWVWNCQ